MACEGGCKAALGEGVLVCGSSQEGVGGAGWPVEGVERLGEVGSG
jgi:hypothetical protein